jgi:hypothetical protein
MPTIANPHRGRPYDVPSDDFRRADSGTGPARSVSLRIRTAARRSELTRALAEGADPSARPELELRAARLTSRRNRNTLARTMRRIVAEARQPAISRSRVVIIGRGAVLDAEDAITAMVERLRSSEPVLPKGIALAERIITNGDQSPLYNASEPGALRRLIADATAAMDPAPAQSHEFPIEV